MKIRFAFFYEPGFPGSEKFFGSEQEDVTGKVPESFNIINAAELASTNWNLNYDILFMPFGGYYPLAAEERLLMFCRNGGDIVVLGGGPFSSPCRIEHDKWRVHDPLDLGDRWRWSFVSIFTRQFGLSFLEVPDKSGFNSDAFFVTPDAEHKEFFGGSDTFPCQVLKGSLQALYAGRKRVIGITPEGNSTAPSVREFITLVEPGFSRDINGRFICAGFLPDDSWTNEKFKSFLSGVVDILVEDCRNRLEYGLSLSAYITRKNVPLQCEVFPRQVAGESSAPLTLKLIDSSGKIKSEYSLNACIDSCVELSIAEEGVYNIELFKGAELINSSSFSVLPAREAPQVKVCRNNGYAAFDVNGELLPAHIYAFNPYNRALDVLSSQFADADIHIHHFLYPLAFGWQQDGGFDWTDFDLLAERVLRNDPQGLLYPRIFLTTPPWWDETHPEELKVFRNGKNFRSNYTLDNNPLNAASKYSAKGFNDKTTTPSWESEVWRRDAAAALESFVKHTQNGSYRGNMLGYFFCGGTYGEWIPMDMMDVHGGLSWEDLSLPSMKSFRSALDSYYKGGSIERERKWKSLTAWSPEDIRIPHTNYVMKFNQEHHYADYEQNLIDAADIPPADIAHAAPPNFVRRHIAKYGIFRDPEQSLDTIEYYRFLKESFVDVISFFSSTIKRASEGKAVIGIFSGSLMNEYLQDGDALQHFLGFGEMLRSVKDLDIATTPYHYYKSHNTPEADGNMRTVPGSLFLSDKIFISENDQRTLAGDSEFWWMLRGDNSLEESCEAMYRNLVICLSHYAGLWWYDFGKGWYDHPKMMRAVAKCQHIYNKVLTEPNPAPLTRIPDTLRIIYSLQSYDYIAACSKLCRANTAVMLQEHMNRIGFPWEVYLQDDLNRIPESRAYLFLNTCALSNQERDYINSRLKCNGNVIIWTYAAGLYKDAVPSPDNVSELTGFNLNWSLEKTVMEVKITDREHPITANLTDEDDQEFSTDYCERGDDQSCISKAAPEFFIDDPDAEILGINPNTGRAAFGVKDFGNWKSVYIACPLVPKNVIRGILRYAGLTQTLDSDDALYTNGDIIGIRAKKAGSKKITLQEEFILENLRKSETICSSDEEVILPMEYGETFIGRISKLNL